MAGRVDILGNTAQPTGAAANPVQVTDTVLTFLTATISRETITLANNEYSYTPPAGTRYIVMRADKSGTIQVALGVGQSNTNFIRCYPGETRPLGPFKTTVNPTIYFRSDIANDELEVISYG